LKLKLKRSEVMSDAKPPRSKPRVRKPKSEAAAQPETQPKAPAPDFAILGGPTEDGEGTQLVRFRDGTITAGELRPVKEGQPITHREVVRLHPLDSERRVMRVETLHAPEVVPVPEAPALSRPARVSNERYRKNYDAIFDSKKPDWSVN
jgi:hypothetical protein